MSPSIYADINDQMEVNIYVDCNDYESIYVDCFRVCDFGRIKIADQVGVSGGPQMT